MDPVTGALIVGGVGAAASYLGGSQANAANAQMSEDNRNFQERMSSTAIRRAAEDAKEAGFNPLLAYGAQSSTPSGSTYESKNLGEGVSSSAKSAMDTYATLKQQDQNKKQFDLQNDLAIKKTNAEVTSLNASSAKSAMETKVLSKGIPEAEGKNMIWDKVKTIINKIGSMDTTADKNKMPDLSGIKNKAERENMRRKYKQMGLK